MNQELDTTNQQARPRVCRWRRSTPTCWSNYARRLSLGARQHRLLSSSPALILQDHSRTNRRTWPLQSSRAPRWVSRRSPSANLAIALSHGYETETIEDSAKAVTVRMTSPKGQSMEVRYTIERATQEGLVKGNKVQYETRPSKMLYWKCIGELTDRMIPHLTGGMPVKEDWEQSPTHKVTATRLDRPSRGASGLKAALGMGETSRQEEPQQADEPAPVDAEFLADIQSTVESFTTTDDINTFADGLKAEGDVPDEVKDIIMSRYNELKEQ